MSVKSKKTGSPKPPEIRPVIGVPLERSISHADKVFYNFLGIAQFGFPFIKQGYTRTDLARNRFALHLLQSDFTHLVMLDLDHIHPVDIVQRLLNNVVKYPDVKIVGGLNFRRGEPYDPCAFIRGGDGKYYPIAQWEPNCLLQVDAVGTGSIVIHRDVFLQIEPPWFWNDYSKVMEDAWPGEDMGFAEKCHQAGIKMYVDTSVTSPHLIDAVVEEDSFRTFIAEHQKEILTPDEIKKVKP